MVGFVAVAVDVFCSNDFLPTDLCITADFTGKGNLSVTIMIKIKPVLDQEAVLGNF